MNKSKTPLGETLWLTEHHAMLEVTVFFTIAMLLTGQDAMPCQCLSSSFGDPASIKASLGAGSTTLMLAGLHADLRNIALTRLFI